MTKKILYVYGGPAFHPTEAGGKILSGILELDGRFEMDMTTDFDAFASLPESDYAAVVIYVTDFDDALTPAREKGLLDFVRSGRGLVGLHSAVACFRQSKAYLEMINAEFDWHPEQLVVPVTIENNDHYLTKRLPDFSVLDELYHLKNFNPDACTVLASTRWQDKTIPLAYVREYGKGRVAVLTNGHTPEVWRHTEFHKLMLRAVSWTTGAELPEKTIRCGLLGYGPAFNMGKGHAEWINATPGMQTIAMCDKIPERVEAAREELPGLKGYFTSLDDMLAMPELDLVVNILPHNLHAPLTIKCLEAGKNVVLEKPFSISVKEADQMIETAHKNGLMLSLFHNRRWDGDYITIHDILQRGLIGEIFHIESFIGGYSHPSFWWRSDKAISGGVMHDWGAHFLDWILNLVPASVTQVTGDFQKRLWHSVTNEDHGYLFMRFANGATADFMVSSIAALPRPKWYILGTKGALRMDHGNPDITLTSYASGIPLESKVKVTLPGYGSTQYYRNVADHLLLGEDLIVKPEQARRVIAMIEAAVESTQTGKSVTPAHES